MKFRYIRLNRCFIGFCSLISVVIGIGIYILFRNTNMLLFQWIPILNFINNIYFPMEHSIFSSILLFNLPDALWFLSGLFFIRFLWFYNGRWQKKYILCFYLIAIIIETTQIFDFIPGTFDIYDLLFIGIIAFVEGLLYKYYFLRRFS